MSSLYLCNTFFEAELSSPPRPLAHWMRSHPAVRKLQTLPLLYAGPNDLVLVSDLPPNPDPRLVLLDSPLPPLPIIDWGPSPSIADWAKKRNLPYSIPPLDTLRTINSKAFSFSRSPRLPHSSLLYTPQEVHSWIALTPGQKVLKTPFGSAGQGHFHIGQSPNLPAFLATHLQNGLPLIAEPWVERTFDFSTQWKDGKLLAATVFENTSKGIYKSTLAGPAPRLFGNRLWALEEHLSIATPLIEEISRLGYLGHLGLDAYLYLSAGKERLQPIVEINGRKTMSWAAHQIQTLRFPNQILHFSFSPSKGALLTVNDL